MDREKAADEAAFFVSSICAQIVNFIFKNK